MCVHVYVLCLWVYVCVHGHAWVNAAPSKHQGYRSALSVCEGIRGGLSDYLHWRLKIKDWVRNCWLNLTSSGCSQASTSICPTCLQEREQIMLHQWPHAHPPKCWIAIFQTTCLQGHKVKGSLLSTRFNWQYATHSQVTNQILGLLSSLVSLEQVSPIKSAHTHKCALNRLWPAAKGGEKDTQSKY